MSAIDLFRNVLAGGRLALFLKAAQWDFRASISQVLLLAATSFGLNFAYDWQATRPDHYFSVDGLDYQATLYLLFLVSIVLIAAARRALHSILALLVMILASGPATFLVSSALFWGLQRQTGVAPYLAYQAGLALYFTWYLLIVLRVFRKVLRPGWADGAAAFAVYVVFNVVPWFMLPNTPLWEAEADVAEAQPAPPTHDLEDLFERQPRLLHSATADILPQRHDTIDMYFLGVAGYASEDVFMHEAQAARGLFDERFDTRGRSLLLVNNEKTLRALPLASTRNLRVAMRLVAQRMDPDEDVLVLFLTSHGDEGAGLALDLGYYQFDELTPAALHEALLEAGVKWRVIIVSSCYSGAFIDALRDPGALIITSARADRTSFGCGHDGEFTYFGQALIGQELKSELSLVSAFEKARADISARERREGRVPSEPQIFVGAAIRPVLDRLIEQLKAGRARPEQDDARALARAEAAPRRTGAARVAIR